MKLKQNIDLSAFIKCVEKCDGNVIFETSEGDRLNIKSTLSQFVFAAFIGGTISRPSGVVVCENERDYEHLSDFLTEE